MRGTTTLVQESYSYRNNGALRRRANNSMADGECFAYDSVNRLERSFFASDPSCEAGVSGLVIYDYDAAGNFEQRSDVGEYTYDPARPLRLLAVDDDSFQYDDVGRQTIRSGPRIAGGSQAIDYTPFGKVEVVTRGDGVAVEYSYAASGERVQRRTDYPNGDLEIARSFGELYERIVREEGAERTVEHFYRVYADGRQVAEVRRGDEPERRHFMLADGLSSTTTVVDASGSVVQEVGYGPFGQLRSPDGSEDPSVTLQSTLAGFTGHRHEADLGLIDMNARMYDPLVGRFITPDSMLFGGTQGLNRYAYVFNDPLNLVDPSGMSATVANPRESLFATGGTPMLSATAAPESSEKADPATTAEPMKSTRSNGVGAGKAPREAPSGTDDAIADTTAGVSSTDGTGAEAVSLGTPQGHTVVGINTGIVDTGDLMNALDGPADAMTATTAALEGFAVGAATAFATPFAIAAVAAVPVVGPAIAAGVIVTMAASTIYGLANGGAQAIHDSGSRLVQGQGMAQDYYLVGAVIGGIIGGRASVSKGPGASRAGTETVQRAMSRAELKAMQETGLLRGGREGTHFVSDAVNSTATRAQSRLALPTRPDVRVTMEVPAGRFSAPSRVQPLDIGGGKVLPGGGMERTATGNIPARVLRVDEL